MTVRARQIGEFIWLVWCPYAHDQARRVYGEFNAQQEVLEFAREHGYFPGQFEIGAALRDKREGKS